MGILGASRTLNFLKQTHGSCTRILSHVFVTQVIHMCNMNYPRVWHDAVVCGMTQWCVACSSGVCELTHARE